LDFAAFILLKLAAGPIPSSLLRAVNEKPSPQRSLEYGSQRGCLTSLFFYWFRLRIRQKSLLCTWSTPAVVSLRHTVYSKTFN
jgi:hypothetical protein